MTHLLLTYRNLVYICDAYVHDGSHSLECQPQEVPLDLVEDNQCHKVCDTNAHVYECFEVDLSILTVP